MSPDTVNHSQVGNVFMLGAGGVFVVALSAYFGRLPVLFWFLIVAVATAAWCAAAASFESFMAARILNGFFSTVAQGGGLMFINDMFFFHERARKINIWSGFIILSECPFTSHLVDMTDNLFIQVLISDRFSLHSSSARKSGKLHSGYSLPCAPWP